MTAQCPTCRGRGKVPAVKVCARPDCGREFAWQDDGRERDHPRTDAVYCSKSCRDAVAQRARRERVSASLVDIH